MSTDIRPNLSKSNPYFIEKERYYELKHFCLQYDIWKRKLQELSYLRPSAISSNSTDISRPTESTAIKAEALIHFMRLVESSAYEAEPELSVYILEAVTKGRTYEYMRSMKAIPCCRDIFYTAYRRFFWILDKKR